MQTVTVVTNSELGCDCVVGVYTLEEDARKDYDEDDGYFFHQARVD